MVSPVPVTPVVLEKIKEKLRLWAQKREYKKASAVFSLYITNLIREDERLPTNDWDWQLIRREIFKYCYLVMVLKDLNYEGSWATIDALLELARNCREELIPRLKMFSGKISCQLEAGFKGVKRK